MIVKYMLLDNYFLNMETKELFLYDKRIAEGEPALDLAFEIGSPSEWTQLDDIPPLSMMKLIETDENSYPF